MPKLRRLSGVQVIDILQTLGFEVVRSKGSHYRLKLVRGDQTCYTTVPVHGSQLLPVGTLRSLLRQIENCLSEEEIDTHFYAA